MITKESLINDVKALNELEFRELLGELAEHMRREKWEHMIDECFEIETYENDLEEMEYRMEHFRDRAYDAEATLKKIKDIL